MASQEDGDVLCAYHKFSDQKTFSFDSYEVGSHIDIATSEEKKNNDKDDDFISELTREMAHFMVLQDDDEDDQFHLSGIGSSDFDMSWDSTDSSQSTLWSPFGSNQGSPEGPSLEPTPPATPCDDTKHSSQDTSYDVVGFFDHNNNNINMDQTSHLKHLHSYGNNLCFNQSLIDQQIRAVQDSMKQKVTTSLDQIEFIEPIQKIQKKGKGSRIGSGNAHRNRLAPLLMSPSGPGPRAGFADRSGSRPGSSGTGVFLPRVNIATSESRKKTGSSTVLIPARVVHALQLHFDQIAATSGPKASAFPPLREVLVSNEDGMYSLQKRQSRREEEVTNMQKETRLPQEWTY